jgi:hypothetical protein
MPAASAVGSEDAANSASDRNHVARTTVLAALASDDRRDAAGDGSSAATSATTPSVTFKPQRLVNADSATATAAASAPQHDVTQRNAAAALNSLWREEGIAADEQRTKPDVQATPVRGLSVLTDDIEDATQGSADSESEAERDYSSRQSTPQIYQPNSVSENNQAKHSQPGSRAGQPSLPDRVLSVGPSTAGPDSTNQTDGTVAAPEPPTADDSSKEEEDKAPSTSDAYSSVGGKASSGAEAITAQPKRRKASPWSVKRKRIKRVGASNTGAAELLQELNQNINSLTVVPAKQIEATLNQDPESDNDINESDDDDEYPYTSYGGFPGMKQGQFIIWDAVAKHPYHLIHKAEIKEPLWNKLFVRQQRTVQRLVRNKIAAQAAEFSKYLRPLSIKKQRQTTAKRARKYLADMEYYIKHFQEWKDELRV